MVELLKATEEDLEELYSLQVEAFMPLYEKYHDDEMSPAKESIERIREKLTRPHSYFYFVTSEGEKVGVIRIVRDYECSDDSIMHISPLFIRPKFQGMGYGGAAIEEAFKLWDKTDIWRLATIKEEPGNCYLYEKYGFVRTGWEQKINDLMTIVGYERKEQEHA
jgi:GNAT superfamily N-acetyltransferase